MQNYLVRIGSDIRKIRKEKGVTIEKMAFDTGLSPATIAELENATLKDVRISTLLKVAEYLKIDFYMLLALAFEDKKLNKTKRELIHKILSIKDKEINKLNSFKEVLDMLDKLK